MIQRIVAIALISYILCQLISPGECLGEVGSLRKKCKPGCYGPNCEYCRPSKVPIGRTGRKSTNSSKLKSGRRFIHTCKNGCTGDKCRYCPAPGTTVHKLSGLHGDSKILSGKSGGQHCKPGCFGYECDYCTSPGNPRGRSLSSKSKGNCKPGCFGFNCKHCTTKSGYGNPAINDRSTQECKPGCFGYNCSICYKSGDKLEGRSISCCYGLLDCKTCYSHPEISRLYHESRKSGKR